MVDGERQWLWVIPQLCDGGDAIEGSKTGLCEKGMMQDTNIRLSAKDLPARFDEIVV